MTLLRQLGSFAFLTFALLNTASAVTQPPFGGLFGASRQSDDALHAVDRLAGTGERIGDISGNVPGFIVGALAREPSTGILYGLGFDPVALRLVVVNPQTGEIDDGAGGDGFITRLDPGAGVPGGDGDEFLAYFSGADFGPDGLLYATIGIFDPDTLLTEPYLASVDTTPVDEDGVLFVNVTPIGMLPATMTGISFDGAGVLWGVSPVLRLHPTGLGNHLFKFSVNPVDGSPDPSFVADFPLVEDIATMSGSPPGAGFASLQFTCDGPLYAANLESVAYNAITIQATYDFPEEPGRFTDFTVTYNDLNGDFRLQFDEIVSFSGVTDNATGNSWDTIIGVPDIFSIAELSGYTDGERTDIWWVDDSTDVATVDPAGWAEFRWSYSTTVTPVFALDGGQVFSIDTSAGMEGVIAPVAAGPGPVSASGGAGMSGFAQATSCGVTSIEDSPTPAGSNVTVISIDSFLQEAYLVTTAGTTSAEFCVGRDARVVRRGNRMRYTNRFLHLSELSHTGTCDDLSAYDLRIAPWLRAYLGFLEYDVNGDGEVEDGEGATDYWIVVAKVTSTAVVDGPVSFLPYFDALIDYSDAPVDPVASCGSDNLDDRAVVVGGTVPAFGDFENTEGTRMIMQSMVCNRPGSLTRRTTHAYPLNSSGGQNDERINMQWQMNGIRTTISEASTLCTASSAPALATMQSLIRSAQVAMAQGRYLVDYDSETADPSGAVIDFEEIARVAKNADFSGCPPDANYRGNFMERAEAAAFTVFDRFFLPSIDGPWQKYFVPADLEIPIHETRPADASPYPYPPAPVPIP